MKNSEISKVKVLKQFSATRQANATFDEPEVQMIPVGAEIDVDIAPAVAPNKIEFNWGGDRFEAKLDNIEGCTTFGELIVRLPQ